MTSKAPEIINHPVIWVILILLATTTVQRRRQSLPALGNVIRRQRDERPVGPESRC